MQRLGGITDWLGAILLGILLILGVASLVAPLAGGQTQTILSVVNPPVGGVPSRPASNVLDIEGRGPMQRAIRLFDGLYDFRWFATAGEADCTFRLVLEGADEPIVLDDYGRIDGGASASGLSRDVRLPAGDHVLVADTDCPGDAHLWVWRYID